MAQFNFSFEPGTSELYIEALEAAGEIWSGHLGDDVEVNVHFQAASLDAGMLGGAIPAFEFQTSYEDVRAGLVSDATSADDLTAVANLPGAASTTDPLTGTTFDAVLDGETYQGDAVSLTRANAKALGLVESDSSALDGVVLLNSDIDWAFNGTSSAAPEASVDLLSVAIHELGHILGFVSGLDSFGTYTRGGNNGNGNGKGPKVLIDGALATDFASPLDLFRYSDTSAASDAIDLTIGEDSFFSLDGGNTRLVDFATGAQTELGGDGFQASHWEANSDDGILDAVLRYGEQASISNLDLQALDAIGYDISAAAGGVDTAAAITQGQASVSGATIANRDADIEALLNNSQIYQQWGYGAGGGYGQWGYGNGGGYGQWGYGNGGGYGQILGAFNQLIGAPDLGEFSAPAESTPDGAPAEATEPPAAENAGGGGNAGGGAATGANGGSIDDLLRLASEQLSGFSDDADLNASVIENLAAVVNGELAIGDLQQLAATIGLLGSDDGVLGNMLADPLVGGMLAGVLPQIGLGAEPGLFYGGTSPIGEG